MPASPGSSAFWGGLLVTALFGFLYYDGNRSNAWPSTDGVVTVSEAEGPASAPTLKFAYQFSVDGEQHRGSRINNALVGVFGELKPAEAVRRYPVGTEVTVYYDPDNLRNTILEPGAPPLAFGGILFGLACTGIGAWFYLRTTPAEFERLKHERERLRWSFRIRR